MGLVKLQSVEELYDMIKKDVESQKPSNRRYPVRFIFVNSFGELQEILRSLIKKWGVDRREIIELLPHEDQWLTADEVVNWIKDIDTNTVVIPFSEFLRFQDKDDFYVILKSLTEIEKQNNIRIYIPLVGLWERFEQEFWNNFYRKDEWAPVWKLETSSSKKIIVYQINFELNCQNAPSEFTIVSTVKDWLNVWKDKDIKSIISLSSTLSYFYKNFLPDQMFELKEIKNQKEFLEEIHRIKTPIRFKSEEVRFWNELLKEVGKYNKIELTMADIFSRHFNLMDIRKLTILDFLTLYLKSSEDYEKWLIKNYFLMSDTFKNFYLYKCFESLVGWKNKDMIKQLWLHIFHVAPEKLTKEIFSERRELLKHIHKYLNFSAHFIEGLLSHKLEKIGDEPLKKKLEYLTNISFVERKFLISELGKESTQEIQKALQDVRKIYPELAYYLDWDLIKPDNQVDDWILKYFKEYNYSKIRHTKSQEIEKLINEKNQDKSSFSDWYYSLSTPKIEDDIKYLWIDGLGAEWFPLLVHLLNKYGKEKEKTLKIKWLTRVKVPSITECNRYEFEKIGDLDRYIHNQIPYKYPDDLVNEIDVVKKIAKEIIELEDKKIGILSDHGFSFLCLKDFGNFKRLDLPKSGHDGRCMWIDNVDYKDDEYFIVWKVDDGFCKDKKALVALKHISLNNTPYREVHGGATPEEVIVPYIVVESKKVDIEYNIELVSSEIWISNPILYIQIQPQPLYIPEAFFNEHPLHISYDMEENDTYKIDLNGLKVGTHTIILKIGDKKYQINVSIKGGFKERDLL